VLLASLVVLYNVRTRALHRHAPYLDLWEWLLWSGLSLFGLLLTASIFSFEFIVVLVIFTIGMGAMLWIRFLPLPADPARLRGAAREAALLHEDEVLAARDDDPSQDRPAGEAPPLGDKGSTDADRDPPLRSRPSHGVGRVAGR
jgi:hypothetical protein